MCRTLNSAAKEDLKELKECGRTTRQSAAELEGALQELRMVGRREAFLGCGTGNGRSQQHRGRAQLSWRERHRELGMVGGGGKHPSIME